MEEFSLSEFMLPEPTFRGKYNNQIRVFYITDIHLIHHFDPSLQNAFFEHLKSTDFEVYKAKAEIRTIVKNYLIKILLKPCSIMIQKDLFPFVKLKREIIL